ncbi:MAG: glycosyltransferase family 2 protein [Chloroflexi bacterium]|nr:glycosyltransferase family 2 protein [Chloroflexota bacterium]
MNKHVQASTIAVIILHWKRADETLACLARLQALQAVPITVLVVDNGGVPLSDAAMYEACPRAVIIRNRTNLGFAGGCNVGIRWAIDHGASYVLLHNDDAGISEQDLICLYQSAEADATIGMIGPTIYYGAQRLVVWSSAGHIDRFGRASQPGADATLSGLEQLTHARDVDYVTGCMLLVRVSAIQQIGLLDEAFFAYYEEAEWCRRAVSAGFRVVWVPAASAWHNIEPNERGESPLHLYLMARNRLLFLRRTRAPFGTVAWSALDLLRTAMSWTLRPRYRQRRMYVPVLLRALADFLLGRFGAPPATL